jgi:hypothetical protein
VFDDSARHDADAVVDVVVELVMPSADSTCVSRFWNSVSRADFVDVPVLEVDEPVELLDVDESESLDEELSDEVADDGGGPGGGDGGIWIEDVPLLDDELLAEVSALEDDVDAPVDVYAAPEGGDGGAGGVSIEETLPVEAASLN